MSAARRVEDDITRIIHRDPFARSVMNIQPASPTTMRLPSPVIHPPLRRQPASVYDAKEEAKTSSPWAALAERFGTLGFTKPHREVEDIKKVLSRKLDEHGYQMKRFYHVHASSEGMKFECIVVISNPILNNSVVCCCQSRKQWDSKEDAFADAGRLALETEFGVKGVYWVRFASD